MTSRIVELKEHWTSIKDLVMVPALPLTNIMSRHKWLVLRALVSSSVKYGAHGRWSLISFLSLTVSNYSSALSHYHINGLLPLSLDFMIHR